MIIGIFGLFKKVPRIQDPVLGEMRYYSSLASGKTLFPPVDEQVEVLVACGPDGPTAEQHDHFHWIAREYSALAVKCADVLTVEFRNWKEDFVIREFAREFELVCISIPLRSTEEWSLSFTSEHDMNHHFTVHFIGDEPDHVLIDG